MSRPFSYNDENFTVIGNVLFCHIKITHSIGVGDNIIEVPSAIYERLMYHHNLMYVVGYDYEPYGGNITTTVKFYNGKYYLRTNNRFTSPPYNYLIGYYFLKDI